MLDSNTYNIRKKFAYFLYYSIFKCHMGKKRLESIIYSDISLIQYFTLPNLIIPSSQIYKVLKLLTLSHRFYARGTHRESSKYITKFSQKYKWSWVDQFGFSFCFCPSLGRNYSKLTWLTNYDIHVSVVTESNITTC